MADIDINEVKDSADAMKESVEGATQSANAFKDSLREMTGAEKAAVEGFLNLDGASSMFASILPAATGAVKGLTGAFSNLKASNIADMLGGGADKLKQLVDTGATSEKQMLNLSGSIASVILAGSGRLKVSKELVTMSGASAEASAQLGEVYDKLLPLIPGGKMVTDKLKEMGLSLSDVFAQADAARNLETAFLRSATSAGDFGDVISSLQGDIGNLSGKVLEYTNQMVDVANANNISFDSAVRLSNMLRKVPGELDMLVQVGGETGKTMNIMSAAIKVAAGTGQEFEAVAGDLNMILRKFNVSGTEAMEVVARMASAAADIKMPMDLMRDFTQKAAEQFKYLGDNSQAAINVMARFGPALRDSGLGPEGIRDIVSGIVEATGQLDIAQRAFVSSQTGGPGGLAGGYDLALKMQEGRMDEVFADVEQTLKRMMGGQLVTLEEAATDQGAAAQMAKQVQMLTTGPLKIAGSEAEAFKILDAFAKGGMPTMEEVKGQVGTPEEVLADTVQTGNDIQSHQLDALNVVRNEAEKQSVIAAFSLDALRKIATGQESNLGQRLLSDRAGIEERAVEREVIGQIPTTSLTDELARTAEGIKSIGKAAADEAKGIVASGSPTGATPMGAVVPGSDEAFINLNEGPAQDVAAGAAIVEAGQSATPAAPEATAREPGTIIIKVMGKDDVLQMIKVKLDEHNNIIGHEEAAAPYGQ